MSTLTHLIKNFTLWEIVKAHMPVLCGRRFWLSDADEVWMMMRALMLLFAFSGATAVHAETVEYGHKLSCEVVKKYEGDEWYQAWRQSSGLKPENHEPSQETWEISFDPPALSVTQMDDAKVAIKVDRGDDNEKLSEASIRSWYHSNRRGKFEFYMRLNGRQGIARIDSLSISNIGSPEDIGLLGFYHERGPRRVGYSIRYSGNCRFVTSQVS